MFKNLKYRILPLLVILLAIAFFSNDGQSRIYKTNAEVLKENNLLKNFSETINYIPKQPVIIITDTILNNGFNIKINYHSIEDAPLIIDKLSKNDTLQKTEYKNFEAQITVSKNNSLPHQFLVNKSSFSNFENNDFFNKAILQYVWIDFEASTKNTICLNTAFHIPETENYRDFVISINKFGIIQIKEKQLTQNII
ncbi:hypothetical protein PW52_15170 [Tamlana sedimentorum]|uniref:Uncharacterized protein n=1 Tax=Neotamlana sedimentorum TaxID=1435349 RepID=A0A0D7W0M7_9FLAO|nr:hypothetical protein [Tamlana sedimentorum]KJD32700.1 hypothetical protein PW52_15170 [Tamlana sedimentorum]